MKKKVFLTIVTVLVLAAMTFNVVFAASYTQTYTKSVYSAGVKVVTVRMTGGYTWGSDGRVKCTATYPRYSVIYLAPGWTATLSQSYCSQQTYWDNGESYMSWSVKKNGVFKGNVWILLSVVKDTTPPNWSWQSGENIQ